MQRREHEVQAALVQVQAFLDEHDALLHDVNTTGARSTLNDVITKLAAQVGDQDVHRRESEGARARHLASRESLLVHYMRAVASACKLLADGVPELAGMSAPPANCGTKTLLDLSDGMLKLAEQHQEPLAQLLGPEFLNRLKDTMAEVRASVVSGRSSRSKRAAATAGLAADTARGRTAVRMLDALVLHALAGNVPLTREWKSCRKVLVFGSSAGEVKPATPAPALVPDGRSGQGAAVSAKPAEEKPAPAPVAAVVAAKAVAG